MNMTEAAKAKARQAPMFKDVAPAALERLFGLAQQRHYRDEELVFGRGEAADKVYLVLSGMVRISSLGESGKRIVVEIFREHDLFGEISAIDAQPRTADAIAYGPLELLQLPNPAFQALLNASSAFAQNVLRITIARLRRTYSLLEDASLLNLELRLAKQVLYLMRLGATGEDRIRILARMHQEDLADLLGATSRSIITILNKWRAEELVLFDGRSAQLTILDLPRFQALVHNTTPG